MLANLLKTLFLVAIPVAGLFGAFHWIDGTYAERTATSIQLHEQAMSNLERDQAKERASNAVKAHEIHLQNGIRREKERIAAAGGQAEDAVKNPQLSLVQMFNQLATACAPMDCRITVNVDHFTEFEVVVDFPQPPGTSAMGEITLCVLSRSAAYLHSIRFTHRGTLVAELTPEALNSVPNWSTLSPTVASSLLTYPTQPTRIANANAPPPANPASQDGTPSDPALDAYNELIRSQWAELNQFIQTLFKAGSLRPYSSATALQEKLVELDQSWTALKPRRDLLSNPVPQLDRLLRQHGLDPLYIEVVLRGERERIAARRNVVDSQFNAMQAHFASTTGFLKAMLQSWGQWSLAGDQIEFDSRDVQQTYRTWSDRVHVSADELNATLAQ